MGQAIVAGSVLPTVVVKPAELRSQLPLNFAAVSLAETTHLKGNTHWVEKSVFVLTVYTDGLVAAGNCSAAGTADQGILTFFLLPAV